MNRHVKFAFTLLLFVLLLFSIYIVPIRQENDKDQKSASSNVTDLKVDAVQKVSVGK